MVSKLFSNYSLKMLKLNVTRENNLITNEETTCIIVIVLIPR